MQINYKHLNKQWLLASLGLLLLIQVLGFVPMDLKINQHATQVTDKQMWLGERVLINQLQHEAQTLKQAAMLLASDETLGDVFLGQEDERLKSALSNYQQTIHADVVYYYSPDNGKITGTMVAKNAEEQAIKELSSTKTSSKLHFMQLNEAPYLMVAVPVKEGAGKDWVMLGRKMHQPLIHRLKQLSNLEISLIQKNKAHQWQMVSSTLNSDTKNKLLNVITKTQTQKVSLKTISYNNATYQLKTRLLKQDKNTALLLVMQSSVTENSLPLNQMKWASLALVGVGLVIFAALLGYVMKATTLPLAELLEAIKEIAKGNYHKATKHINENELGQFGQAVNEMREAVSAREAQVHSLAYGDELTGLANRLGFLQTLHNAVLEHEKTNSSLSVLVMNIDRFKQINHILGRDFGDDVLRYMANMLNQCLITNQGVVARLDADEFAVILHETDQEKATAFARALNQKLENPVQVNEQLIDLRVGIGIAIYPTHANSEEALLHKAETAQQKSKQRKNGWIVYNSALEIDHNEKLRMMTELKEAIKNHQLVMYLQPKVNTKTRALVGAEALLRWVHPDQGMMLPEQFVPLIEHTPTMTQMTYWMIEEACRVMVAFKQQLMPLKISVNLASRDIHNLDLPNQIQKRMQAHGLNPKVMHLEITENALMEDPKRAATVLRKIAELGMQITIDEFGTGYSSMNYLRELPLNVLKIDKSFVKEMHRNTGDKAIVRSSIELAHNLGLKVVADGIESEETIKQLAFFGCDEGQGHYISKPMPVRDFGIWLERWNNQISQLEYDFELPGSPLDLSTTNFKPTLELARQRETITEGLDAIAHGV